MKKWLFLIVAMVLFGAFFLLSKPATPEQYVAQYKVQFGIDLPVPDEVYEVWSTEASFHGDGEWVTEFRYNKPLQPYQLQDLTEITEQNLAQAVQYVTHFLTRTTDLHRFDQDDKFSDAIAPYRTPITQGDYFYHQTKNKDYDTLTIVYEAGNHRIMIYEWHQ